MKSTMKRLAEQAGWDMGSEECGFSTRLEKFAELIAAVERESVATSNKRDLTCICGAVWEGEQMVCTPRRREWVGLTDEEINSVRHNRDWTAHWTDATFARAIEAK